MNDTLKIETLGRLNLQHNGNPVNGALSARAKALIVYLAINHYEHSRKALSNLFLNEFESESNFRKLLHEIRKALPDCFIIDNHSVMINPSINCWLDAIQIEEQMPELCHIPTSNLTPQDIKVMESLVALYQGEFLSGVLVDTVEFEFWRHLFAQNLVALAICALDRVVEYYMRDEHYQLAMQQARDLLQLDSYRSESYRKMMRILALIGQRRAALETYATCVRKLSKELGLDPSPETTQLYEDIKAGRVVGQNS